VDTRSEPRSVRFLLTVKPALENTRSDAAEDTGTASHLRATKDNSA
jgi:hypothetical protein